MIYAYSTPLIRIKFEDRPCISIESLVLHITCAGLLITEGDVILNKTKHRSLTFDQGLSIERMRRCRSTLLWLSPPRQRDLGHCASASELQSDTSPANFNRSVQSKLSSIAALKP
jgi:hypothetical protein